MRARLTNIPLRRRNRVHCCRELWLKDCTGDGRTRGQSPMSRYLFFHSITLWLGGRVPCVEVYFSIYRFPHRVCVCELKKFPSGVYYSPPLHFLLGEMRGKRNENILPSPVPTWMVDTGRGIWLIPSLRRWQRRYRW